MPRKKQKTPSSKVIGAADPDLERHFPGGFTVRDEANALTAYAFRNGPLEDLHSGLPSPLAEDPKYSRITNAEMRDLMIDASQKLEQLLTLKRRSPKEYRLAIMRYNLMYCRAWNR